MPNTYYAETVWVSTSRYTVTVGFGGAGAQVPSESLPLVALHPEVAKHLCMLLRKQLREYEARFGDLTIPMEVLKQMDVSPDDW